MVDAHQQEKETLDALVEVIENIDGLNAVRSVVHPKGKTVKAVAVSLDTATGWGFLMPVGDGFFQLVNKAGDLVTHMSGISLMSEALDLKKIDGELGYELFYDPEVNELMHQVFG